MGQTEKIDLLFGSPKQEDPENTAAGLLSREYSVLGRGFVDGIGRAGNQAMSETSQFFSNLKEAPLDTTTKFVGDHWHEAAVGAAITFVNPRGLANKLLVAYSLKGVAVSTFDAAVDAANPNVDVNAAKERYASSLGHEGSAFLTTLPTAMVGGVAGRVGANAIFGKGFGAGDLLTGNLNMSQVKNNLWNLHDAVRPPQTKLVITDMDNTLAPFGKYFARGVEEAIGNLSKKTGIQEAELYKSIGSVMEARRSHDYPWSLEVALSDKLNVGKPGGMTAAQFRSEIAEPFWSTIDKSLERHLKPFDDVIPTLKVLQDRNIPVAVLSDAPAFVGLRRLTYMSLDKQGLTERLYALHNWERPPGLSSEVLRLGEERVSKMLNTPHSLKEFQAIPHQWEKPNPLGYQMLLDRYKVRAGETLMVGDSRVKDVGVAVKAGARGLWASYGNNLAADEAILTRLRPLPENGAGVGQTKPKVYPPRAGELATYSDLLKYIDRKPDYSRISKDILGAFAVRPEAKALLGVPAMVQDK